MAKVKTIRKIRPQVKIFLICLVIFWIGYLLWNNFSQFIVKKDFESKQTNIQKEYFDKVQSTSGLEKEKNIAKGFVSEFFSLREKSRKGDVGGIRYFDPNLKDDFLEKVFSTYYEYFDEIRLKDGQDNMPSVENVVIEAILNTSELPYTSRVAYDSKLIPKNVKAFECKIIYSKDTANVKRYHTHATVYIQKQGDGYKVIKLVSN